MQRLLSSPPGDIKRVYDVVVVGSGYGGGVAASRLSRAGQSVCVIEKGKEFLTGSFPSRLPELRRELQLNGGKVRSGSRTGLFDFRLGADIHVLVGCGLGGGSLINAGVALRPDARVFADPVWPGELAADGLLELGFKRAAAMLRPARLPNAPELTKYRALVASSEAFGVPPVAAPVVVSFEDIVNPAGVAQPGCTLCGDCCSGCNVGAKNTVAVTYLADAKAHGADIFTELSVNHVAKGEGGWRVHFAPSNDQHAGPDCVDAKTVVLAAGTLGSTEILLRSRERGLGLSDSARPAARERTRISVEPSVPAASTTTGASITISAAAPLPFAPPAGAACTSQPPSRLFETRVTETSVNISAPWRPASGR
jgi:cholesterol oxidase